MPTGKDKGAPVKATKAYGERRGRAPLILNTHHAGFEVVLSALAKILLCIAMLRR